MDMPGYAPYMHVASRVPCGIVLEISAILMKKGKSNVIQLGWAWAGLNSDLYKFKPAPFIFGPEF